MYRCSLATTARASVVNVFGNVISQLHYKYKPLANCLIPAHLSDDGRSVPLGSRPPVSHASETGVSTFEKPDELKTAQERHRVRWGERRGGGQFDHVWEAFPLCCLGHFSPTNTKSHAARGRPPTSRLQPHLSSNPAPKCPLAACCARVWFHIPRRLLWFPCVHSVLWCCSKKVQLDLVH